MKLGMLTLCVHYVEENGSAAMLATKRLVDVAPVVTLGDHVAHTPLLM